MFWHDIPNLATITKPLRRLKHKGCKTEHENTYQTKNFHDIQPSNEIF